MKPVDIIILNRDGLNLLQICISSLYKNTLQPFHLIVVDNGSKDGSVPWLRNFSSQKDMTVEFNKNPNTGFAAGNNIGLRHSKSEFVLLLNNDTIISQKGWLKTLVKCMKDPEIGVVGMKLLYPNNLIQHAGIYFRMDPSRVFEPQHIGRFQTREKYNKNRELASVTFASALIRKDLLEKTLGLDETYNHCFEDIDFCCRGRKEFGYKIFYCGSLEMYHYEGATFLKKDPQIRRRIIAKGFKIFTERWNDWIRKDYKKNPEIYQEKRE